MIAAKAGFSSALGAFVMGSLLAETIEAEKIEKLVNRKRPVCGHIFCFCRHDDTTGFID